MKLSNLRPRDIYLSYLSFHPPSFFIFSFCKYSSTLSGLVQVN